MLNIEVSREYLENLPYVNVKDFGARGDSIHDDTLSIQSAIEFASLKGSPATFEIENLYLPKLEGSITEFNESVLNKLVSRKDARKEVDASLSASEIEATLDQWFVLKRVSIDRASAFARTSNGHNTHGGGRVFLPSGTYRILKPLKLPLTGDDNLPVQKGFFVSLEGESTGGTVIRGDDDKWMTSDSSDEIRGLIEWELNYEWRSLIQKIYHGVSAAKYHYKALNFIRELENHNPPEIIDHIFYDLTEAERKTYLDSLMAHWDTCMEELLSSVGVLVKDSNNNPKKPYVVDGGYYHRALHQEVSNLTFWLPAKQRAVALYKRCAWLLYLPDVFEQIEHFMKDTFSQELSGQISKWETLKKKWYTDMALPRKAAMEGSRLQIDLKNLTFHANNVYHRSVCKFEGSLIKSSLTHLKVNIHGSNDLKRVGEYSPDFKTHAPKYDPIFLDFDKGILSHFGSDAVGFQTGKIEDVTSMGATCCVFKGRFNAFLWDGAFANGALFGPSYHFVNSCNSILNNLHSEGSKDKPTFLFEKCRSLRVNTFGIGTPTPAAPPKDASNYVKDAYKTAGGGIRLVECQECIFDGRGGATPRHLYSYQDLKAKKETEQVNTPVEEQVLFSMDFVMIHVDMNSFRNEFRNIETVKRTSILPQDLQFISDMKNDTNFAASAIKDICNNWIQGEIFFENLDGMNSASGWIYFNLGVQQELNNHGFSYCFHQPSYISPADLQTGYLLNAGHPFKIGTTLQEWMD